MIKLIKTVLNTIPRPLLIKLSYLVRPIFAFLLKGSTYTDPIDNRSFRKFLPYGYGNIRENVLSPSTFSLERHRLLWLYLTNHTDFFSTKRKVLHIAPEQCFLKRFRKLKNIDYTTADLYSPIADVKADIKNLPFKDNEFDIIFCNHVLEHIDDDELAMKELYRTLKKGGFGIFQVPMEYDRKTTYEDASITEPEARKIHFGQYDHVRIYGLDYFEKLKKIGFEVAQINLSNQMSEKDIRKFCLSKGEILPICKK